MINSLQVFPAEYHVTEQDALQYSRGCMVSMLLLLISYGLVVEGLIPVISLPLIVLLVLPRWVINVHELIHIYDEECLNPLIRLMGASAVPLSVLSLSYGEIRSLHFAHHQAPTTEKDPDAYHIQGNWLQVAFNAFTTPEQNAFRWIANHGMNLRMGADLAIKLSILSYLAWIGGTAFLWFWLSLRIVYGLGDLAFFRLVHHQRGRYGTFALSLPKWLTRLSELIFGATVIRATLHHDIHHQNPYIAAHHLPSAREYEAGNRAV